MEDSMFEELLHRRLSHDPLDLVVSGCHMLERIGYKEYLLSRDLCDAMYELATVVVEGFFNREEFFNPIQTLVEIRVYSAFHPIMRVHADDANTVINAFREATEALKQKVARAQEAGLRG